MKAMLSDPDTLSFDQVMQGEDKDKWLDTAQSEISQLTEKGTWQEVPQSEAATKIIPGTWVFCCMWHPDGTVKKYKRDTASVVICKKESLKRTYQSFYGQPSRSD